MNSGSLSNVIPLFSHQPNSEGLNEKGYLNFKSIWAFEPYGEYSPIPDIDLLYFEDTETYELSLETIYEFESVEDERAYLKNLLKEFEKWMTQSGYSTNRKHDMSSVFENGINPNSQFKTIEDMYFAFKMFVNGYCSL